MKTKRRDREAVERVLYDHLELRPNLGKASRASGIPVSTLWDHWQRMEAEAKRRGRKRTPATSSQHRTGAGVN